MAHPGKRHHKREHAHSAHKGNSHRRKFCAFVEKYRSAQKEDGYVTTYKEHKMDCKRSRSRWEAVPIIDDFLWLGSVRSAQNFDTLYKLGITYVLNCADSNEIQYNEQDFEYLRIDAKDKQGYNIIGKHLEDAVGFIEKARNSNAKILVHCIGGVNRSATLVIAYLLHLQLQNGKELSLVEATTLVMSRRPFVLTNESFMHQLVDHEHCLQKEFSKKQKRKKQKK